MCNIQMNFFHSKISKLMDTLPTNNLDPASTLAAALNKWNGAHDRNMFTLKEINETETVEIIKLLGNNTSFRDDKLDARTIKIAADILYSPRTHLINLSITKTTFANKWKIACVLPLYKGKNKDCLQPGSYRPICLLSVISKIVEKAVQRQLVKFMK